eukprot:CAMPEP_0176121490 /NCGR_PEP_ID=MMETSP0120_2-20121206/61154_1 /TAXON_ID=160619 /ORGANISM="Kryptoperidinium foliaceum, Strain CCMP 1326" /LENGTH=539 /DNA_ID=CAMNT_0017456041 /DNA_START=119 /DNA_END=1736 /DNA_ORIENTATION=+
MSPMRYKDLRRSASRIGIDSVAAVDNGSIRKSASLSGVHQFSSLADMQRRRQLSESTPDLRRLVGRQAVRFACPEPAAEASAPCPSNRKSLALICLLSVIDGMDIQLLPASFKALEADLGLRPTNLALLAVCQGYAMCISGPFWGSIADSGFPRKYLLAAGSVMWGLLTLALALVETFHFMVMLRTLNGVALGLLTPVIQSIIAEMSAKTEMGFSFGCIDFCHMAIGQALALVVVSSFAGQEIMGVAGWRVAFAGVAVMSILVAIPIVVCIDEKPRPWRPQSIGLLNEAKKFFTYMRMPSFLVLVSQGMFGTIPGSAMAFTTMYFQYIGVSGSLAGLVTAFKIVGTGIGSVLGGIIGDNLAMRSPMYGRALTAQFSVLMCIPIASAVFLLVPAEASMWTVHAGLLFLLGLLHWCSSGCNKPILVELVEPDSIGSVVAWQNCVEHMSGFILGPVGVALLSELCFDYVPARRTTAFMPQWEKEANAAALGQSLAVCTAIPWTACFCFYGFLHFTYPLDQRRMAKTTGEAWDTVEDEDTSDA